MKSLTQDKEMPIPALLYFIVYMIFIYFFSSLPIPALLNFGSKTTSAETIQANTWFLVVNIGVAILGMILFYRRFKNDWMRVKKAHYKAILYIIAVVAIFLIGSFLPFPTGASENEMAFLNMGYTLQQWQVPLYLLVLIVTGPIIDGLIYCEILINQLSHYLSPYLLSVISAVLFSFSHMTNIHDWVLAIPYFITMLAANIFYIKTKGNLWYLILGHIITMIISVFMMM